jgi:SAM-dependent methyltransferase
MGGIGHDLFDYEGMYESQTELDWRELCARDKVQNQLVIFDELSKVTSLKILEVGCGDGSIARELSRSNVFSEYVGLDISPSGIEAAYKMNIPRSKFFCMSATEILEYKSTSTVTLLCHVVEHLDDPRSILLKAKDWSEFLVVEVPLEDNIRMGQNYDWNPVGHINKFKISTIRILVQTCGWEIVSARIYNPSRRARTFFASNLKTNSIWFVKDIAFRLNKRAASKFFTYHYLILAQNRK